MRMSRILFGFTTSLTIGGLVFIVMRVKLMTATHNRARVIVRQVVPVTSRKDRGHGLRISSSMITLRKYTTYSVVILVLTNTEV